MAGADRRWPFFQSPLFELSFRSTVYACILPASVKSLALSLPVRLVQPNPLRRPLTSDNKLQTKDADSSSRSRSRTSRTPRLPIRSSGGLLFGLQHSVTRPRVGRTKGVLVGLVPSVFFSNCHLFPYRFPRRATKKIYNLRGSVLEEVGWKGQQDKAAEMSCIYFLHFFLLHQFANFPYLFLHFHLVIDIAVFPLFFSPCISIALFFLPPISIIRFQRPSQ